MKFYEEFYDNGQLKCRCPLNINGNLNGYMVCYDEKGNEIEKIKYSDGICLGNPFKNKNFDEIFDMLGEDTNNPFQDEEPDSQEIYKDRESLSTLLKGEKYYGK